MILHRTATRTRGEGWSIEANKTHAHPQSPDTGTRYGWSADQFMNRTVQHGTIDLKEIDVPGPSLEEEKRWITSIFNLKQSLIKKNPEVAKPNANQFIG